MGLAVPQDRFSATPLLMGRVAAAMARLLQSLCRPWETMLQCYMDELLVMVQGAKAQHDQALAMTVLTMQVLRVRIETRRASRGPSVSWMGVTPSANSRRRDIDRRGLSWRMVTDLLQTLVSWTARDEIPLVELRSVTGLLRWLTGLAPRIQLAAFVFHAVVGDAEQDQTQQPYEVIQAHLRKRRGLK